MLSVTNKSTGSSFSGKGIYLDNAASVPCPEKYLRAFMEYSLRYPGNQESMAFHGAASSRAVREAGEKILDALGAPQKEYSIHFCNSGTEGAGSAVQALCMASGRSFPEGGRIVTTPLEHAALLRALERAAERYGCTLVFAPVSRSGLCVESFEELLDEKTVAVAVHHVESQTGSILDLCRLRQMMEERSPRALLLADTVQSAGKLELDLQKIRPDLFLISGQKLAVPSSGAVICRAPVGKCMEQLRGKDHLYGRSTPGAILTLAEALAEQLRDRTEIYHHVSGLCTLLEQELQKHALPFRRTLSPEKSSPFIYHCMCTPYQGAILTRALYRYGVSVAPGSACESETPSGSAVLSSMGYSRAECFCGLRISFSGANTAAEICSAAESLSLCVADY